MQVREAKGGAAVSDTPKTDANCGWPVGQHGRINSSDLIMGADGPFVHSSIARELERELNERELSEQLLIDGKGSEREAALLAKVEQLERENAALRGALEQAEDALRHALIMSPLDPFQRGKVISAAIDVARAALNAARREGTP